MKNKALTKIKFIYWTIAALTTLGTTAYAISTGSTALLLASPAIGLLAGATVLAVAFIFAASLMA